MDKYFLISKKYGKLKRGAYTVTERWVEKYPTILDALDIDSLPNLDQIRTTHRRLILITQVPALYGGKWSIVRGINDVVTIRPNVKLPSVIATATNGFSVYKNFNHIRYFIPQITDMYQTQTRSFERPSLGFYYRPNIAHNSSKVFTSLLDTLNNNIDVLIFGYQYTGPKITNRKIHSFNHTFDNIEFFSNITHYLHVKDQDFIDPFPNALLEAVQCNKQVIILNENVGTPDGVNDIASCISYSKELRFDTAHDNSKQLITADIFDTFCQKLFVNNFEYVIDRSKYKTFQDWIVGELL